MISVLRNQRSHLLLALSNAKDSSGPAFLDWYLGDYFTAVSAAASVLRARHYEQHEVDITRGRRPRIPFRYLGLYELSIDGAEAAATVIKLITSLHRDQSAAEPPATWLYYPASEKVGKEPSVQPSMLAVAFANGIGDQQDAFREWYATRHIRHALIIPALVSGQCFERTQFQQPGVLAAGYKTIAIYEQDDTPEAVIESFAAVPKGALDFPMLDTSRFSEWVYRPLKPRGSSPS